MSLSTTFIPQGLDVSRTLSTNGKWVTLDESGQPLDTNGILQIDQPYNNNNNITHICT